MLHKAEMHILRDAAGASAFIVYGPDDLPTGLRISYLHEQRNGADFTWGFNPDTPHALEAAIADFERYLDLEGGKETPDA
jgi:hypothetical protein